MNSPATPPGRATGRRTRVADLAAAGGAAGLVIAEVTLWQLADGLRGYGFLSWSVLAVALILAAAMLVRRAAPAWAPLGPAVVLVWLAVAQPAGAAPFMFAVASTAAALAYLAGAATGRLAAPVGFAVLAVGTAGCAVLIASPDAALFAPIVLALFGGLPWLLGRYRSQQRELVRAGRERIAQLERAQDMLAERVRLRERAELAEEMHDSLGHDLTLLALRAGALELAPDLPAPQRTAVGQLRAAAGAATARLAEIVTVLRDQGPPPEPTIEPLSRLVERARDSGMVVTLTGAGTPPPEAARTAHRIVTEALTNAAKHAPGAPVAVEVDADRTATMVVVTNPVPPPDHQVGSQGDPVPGHTENTSTSAPGAGSGLAALRERVRLLGGDLRAGRSGGAFELWVRLPAGGVP